MEKQDTMKLLNDLLSEVYCMNKALAQLVAFAEKQSKNINDNFQEDMKTIDERMKGVVS
jgi:hypothetical protein